MTAIPHDSVSARGLRRPVVRPRLGARLVRPVKAKTSSAAVPVVEEVAVANSVAVAAAPIGLAGIPSLLGLRHLRFVLAGKRVRMGNGAFVITVLGLLTAMLGGLLVLNTALAETSFQLTNIRTDMRELTVREQMLSTELAAAESPIGLEQKAKELGMVAAGSPLFLRLEDGKLLGEQTPALPYSPLDIPEKYQTSVPAGETEAKLASPDTSSTAVGGGESAASSASSGESSATSSGETSIGITSEASR